MRRPLLLFFLFCNKRGQKVFLHVKITRLAMEIMDHEELFYYLDLNQTILLGLLLVPYSFSIQGTKRI